MHITVRRALLALAFVTLSFRAGATDLQVTTREALNDRGVLELSVSWNNAWHTERNHDAAWVFLKYRQQESTWWRHASLESAESDGATVVVAPDGAGLYVIPPAEHRGDIDVAVRVRIAESVLNQNNAVEEVRPFGIEMVEVPAGPYWLGGTDDRGINEFAAYHAVDADGAPAGPYHVRDESTISVGQDEGSLFYMFGTEWSAQYEGDQAGPVPTEFPKGTDGFYIMKYEITQGQYAGMLNTLGDAAANFRSIHGGPEYRDHRGTIELIDGEFVAGAPHRPGNYISWDDGCAFADWAALRPMTELEFTKACRGPDEPVSRDYPWGTDSKDRLQRVLEGDEFVRTGAADESLLTDATRDVLGASHYWVMDLAGSTWERCVTIGHPAGRAFVGSHGDGMLTQYGSATNEDWPRGDDNGGGYGYRGGGHYESDREYEPDGFNPHSPVAWRRFGSWGSAPRSKAYGFRCVRTIDR